MPSENVQNILTETGLEQLKPKIEIYFGGPVQTDTMHFLHDLGDIIEDSVQVTENVYWGVNFEVAKSLIQQNEAKSTSKNGLRISKLFAMDARSVLTRISPGK